MLHGDDDLGSTRVGHEIHGAAEALDLAGQHPIRQVARATNLHGAEDGQVDAPAADHTEALLAAEDGRPGLQGHRLLAGVDQIRIFLAPPRVGPQPQDAVLRLQLDLDLGPHEGRRQHRHSDPQVGVHAVAELLGGAAHDALALGRRVAGAQSGRLAALVVAVLLGEGELLDALLARALDHARDVDAGQVDGLGRDLPGLHDVLGLDDGDARVAAHGAVEVVGGEPELGVAEAVGPPRLDEGVVPRDAVLEHVRLAAEHLDVLRVGELVGRPVALVPQREVPRLHHGPEARGRVEGRDPLAAGCAALRERALRRQLQLHLPRQVHLLEGLVLADVAGYHLPDLLRLEQLAQAGGVGPRVVGHGRQALQLGLLQDLVDQGVGDAAEPEPAAE